MNDFTSNFWVIYTAVIIVASFLGLVWLLVSQNKTKKTGDTVETMGHEWDGIEEYNNPLPRWWFYLFVITVVFGVAYLSCILDSPHSRVFGAGQVLTSTKKK